MDKKGKLLLIITIIAISNPLDIYSMHLHVNKFNVNSM